MRTVSLCVWQWTLLQDQVNANTADYLLSGWSCTLTCKVLHTNLRLMCNLIGMKVCVDELSTMPQSSSNYRVAEIWVTDETCKSFDHRLYSTVHNHFLPENSSSPKEPGRAYTNERKNIPATLVGLYWRHGNSSATSATVDRNSHLRVDNYFIHKRCIIIHSN